MSVRDWFISCVSLKGGRPDWVMGFVGAFTFLVPGLIGLATGVYSTVLIVPLVAFMVVNMTPRDSWLTRRLVSGIIGSVAAAIVVFCSLWAAPYVLIAAALFALLAFLSGLLFAFGRAWLTTAIILPVVATIGFGLPTASPSDIVTLSVGAFLGGLWAVVVIAAFALLSKDHPVAVAISDMYRDIGAQASALASASAESSTDMTQAQAARLKASASIDHALDVTAAPFVSSASVRGKLNDSRRLIARGAAIASVLVETQFTLTSTRATATPEQNAELDALAQWCTTTADTIASQGISGGVAAVQVAAVDADDSDMSRSTSLAKSLVAAMQLPGPTELPSMWSDGGPWQVLMSILQPGSACLRNAGRVAIAAGVAGILAELLNPLHGWWIGITIVVVLKAGVGDTLTSVARRTLGTIVGAIAAGLLSVPLSGHNVAVLCVIGVVIVPMVALHWVNYTYWAAGISIFLLLTMTVNAPPIGWQTSAERIIDTFIGAAICIAATLLLWPNKSRVLIPAAVGGVASATATYMKAAADRTKSAHDLLGLKRQILLHESNAHVAIAGAHGEPGTAMQAASLAPPIITGCQVTRDATSVFARELRATPDSYTADDLVAVQTSATTLEGLAKSLEMRDEEQHKPLVARHADAQLVRVIDDAVRNTELAAQPLQDLAR